MHLNSLFYGDKVHLSLLFVIPIDFIPNTKIF